MVMRAREGNTDGVIVTGVAKAGDGGPGAAPVPIRGPSAVVSRMKITAASLHAIDNPTRANREYKPLPFGRRNLDAEVPVLRCVLFVRLCPSACLRPFLALSPCVPRTRAAASSCGAIGARAALRRRRGTGR